VKHAGAMPALFERACCAHSRLERHDGGTARHLLICAVSTHSLARRASAASRLTQFSQGKAISNYSRQMRGIIYLAKRTKATTRLAVNATVRFA